MYNKQHRVYFLFVFKTKNRTLHVHMCTGICIENRAVDVKFGTKNIK